MIKLRSKKLFKRSSKLSSGESGNVAGGCGRSSDIAWELRPGGMLVQKREGAKCDREGLINVRVSTGSHWHDISIEATSTFAELKMVVSIVTGLEPREQRLLFRGKEREDGDHLHMVGVRDRDKVLLLEDPAIKEMKLKAVTRSQVIGKTLSHHYSGVGHGAVPLFPSGLTASEGARPKVLLRLQKYD